MYFINQAKIKHIWVKLEVTLMSQSIVECLWCTVYIALCTLRPNDHVYILIQSDTYSFEKHSILFFLIL